MSDGDSAPEKHRGLKAPWQPGQSGNPNGRQKGSRNRLGEEFIQALHDDFKEHGVGVIQHVRANSPVHYVKALVALMPREVNVKLNPLEEMADEELMAAIDALRQYVAGDGSRTVQ